MTKLSGIYMYAYHVVYQVPTCIHTVWSIRYLHVCILCGLLGIYMYRCWVVFKIRTNFSEENPYDGCLSDKRLGKFDDRSWFNSICQVSNNLPVIILVIGNFKVFKVKAKDTCLRSHKESILYKCTYGLVHRHFLTSSSGLHLRKNFIFYYELYNENILLLSNV